MKNSTDRSPCLFVVATPIGNLSDFSERAKRTLQAVDLILAEDTRHAKKLLSSFGITGKHCVSYHDHVERQKAPAIIARMQEENLQVALISDAGTPGIADPGYVIVAAAHAAGIRVSPIPGPSALLALASSAGLPTDRLMFVGFLPDREKARRTEIESWRGFSGTILFYEALRRAAKTLPLLAELFPLARVAIGREMTKLYEEILQMSAAETVQWLDNLPVQKGELAVAIWLGEDAEQASVQAVTELQEQIRQHAIQGFRRGLSLKDLLRHWSQADIPRSDLYQLLLEVKKEVIPDD